MSLPKELGFISHECNNCGNCCRRGNLSLTPLDVYNISHYLELSTKDFLDRYCDTEKGFDVCVRIDDSTKKCIFFDPNFNQKGFCRIYDVRPMACYLYPLKFRPESKDSFFIDSAAPCPSTGKKMTFLEYVEKKSNGRYADDWKHYQRFCMAIGAFYSDEKTLSQSEMFEFLFYNNSAEEATQKLEHYLFGK